MPLLSRPAVAALRTIAARGWADAGDLDRDAVAELEAAGLARRVWLGLRDRRPAWTAPARHAPRCRVQMTPKGRTRLERIEAGRRRAG